MDDVPYRLQCSYDKMFCSNKKNETLYTQNINNPPFFFTNHRMVVLQQLTPDSRS